MRRSLTYSALAVLFGSLALAAASCAAIKSGPAAGAPLGGSPKLNPTVFFEDGNVAFIGVDTRAAQYVKDGTLLPLGIGLANRSKGSLTFTRESFVLEDSEGRKVPLASYGEFQPYTRAATDARLLDAFVEVVRARFGNFAFTDLSFFPIKGGSATARDTLELGRTTWTVGNLYFPLPEGGIHGKAFSMLVRVKEVPETLVVKFTLR
jgi:hypothetical protein